jgi:sugar phosphate isomerase/epimerase
MKLAFSTLSCPNWSWEKILDEAQQHRYDGIEFRGVNGEMFLPAITAFSPENIQQTSFILKEKGLEITDLGSSVSFHDPTKFDKAIQEGKAYIDLAQRLNVPYVRIFGDKIPDFSKKEETITLISRGIDELCRYCLGKNVMCLLETHGDFADLSNLMPLIEQVNHPLLGLIWDVAHTYKIYGDDTSELLNKIFKYIKHVHIKDVKKIDNEFALCMIGEGNIPIKNFINDLKSRGYEGFLSLEWEKKWVPSLEEPEVVVPLYANYMRAYI